MNATGRIHMGHKACLSLFSWRMDFPIHVALAYRLTENLTCTNNSEHANERSAQGASTCCCQLLSQRCTPGSLGLTLGTQLSHRSHFRHQFFKCEQTPPLQRGRALCDTATGSGGLRGPSCSPALGLQRHLPVTPRSSCCA